MSSNKFKNFYQLNKARKTPDFASMDYKHLEEPFIELLMRNTSNEKQYDDSFDELLTTPLTSKEVVEP